MHSTSLLSAQALASNHICPGCYDVTNGIGTRYRCRWRSKVLVSVVSVNSGIGLSLMNNMVLCFSRRTYLPLSVWSVSTHIMNSMVLCFSRRTCLSVCLSLWSVSTHIMNNMVFSFSRRTYLPLSVCLSVWSVSTHIMNNMVLCFSRRTYLPLSVCLSVCLSFPLFTAAYHNQSYL